MVHLLARIRGKSARRSLERVPSRLPRPDCFRAAAAFCGLVGHFVWRILNPLQGSTLFALPSWPGSRHHVLSDNLGFLTLKGASE